MAEEYNSNIYKGNNIVKKLFKDNNQVLKVYKYNTLVYEWIGDTPQEKYTILEYIQSNGGGYFDTDYIPTNNTSVEMKASINRVNFPLLGGRISASNKDLMIGLWAPIYTETYYTDYGNKRYSVTIPNDNKTYLTTFKVTPSGAYHNGELVSSYSEYTEDFENSLIINGCKTNGVVNLINNGFSSYYGCKIFDGDNVVHDYKPAKRNEDNAIGLYDEITDTFLESQGGDFSEPETENIYAKFDKASYFETNVTISSGTQNFQVKCGVYIDKKEDMTTTQCPFGMRYGTSTVYSFCPLHTVAADGWRMNLGSNMTVTAITTTDDTEYELSMQISGSQTSKTSAFDIADKTHNFYITNRQTSRTYSTTVNNRRMWVGAMNDSQNFPCYFGQYMKYVRVYRNDVLINNFVFREVDGVVKMYDTVNNRYYNNLGTGQLELVDINKIRNT